MGTGASIIRSELAKPIDASDLRDFAEAQAEGEYFFIYKIIFFLILIFCSCSIKKINRCEWQTCCAR